MPGLIAHYGVFIVALIIFAGEIGLPTLVPGEIAILIVGGQVVRSVPQLICVWVLFGVIDIVACSTIHTACRTSGNRVLVRLLRYLQPDAQRHEEIVEGWRRRLGGRDSLVVFVTRLIPIGRLYASVTTGLIRVRLSDWFTGVVPASMIWAATPLTLGFLMRSKVKGMEHQYPQFIHYVILSSVLIVVLMGVACWVRAAGTRAGALRRVRIAFSLGAFGGALSRLVLVALYGDQRLSRWDLLPPLSALSVWVTLLSLVALGLLWIAARDLRATQHRQQRRRGVSAHSTALWVGLMLMFCALNAMSGVHQPVGI